nr:hypothetical protein CFP56_70628 [Quercus suber]
MVVMFPICFRGVVAAVLYLGRNGRTPTGVSHHDYRCSSFVRTRPGAMAPLYDAVKIDDQIAFGGQESPRTKNVVLEVAGFSRVAVVRCDIAVVASDNIDVGRPPECASELTRQLEAYLTVQTLKFIEQYNQRGDLQATDLAYIGIDGLRQHTELAI